MPGEIDVLEAVTEILNDISNAELRRVFQNWVECVQRVIDAGGDYLTE
jgi:predicted SprT family Zn-dependent metalloprotease